MSTDLNNFPPKFKNLPSVNLGNLNGPEGNIFFIQANVVKGLKSHGYTSEAEELFNVIKLQKSYEDALDVISHFVDITPKEEVVDYDDEYLYVKIKRTDNKHDKKNNIPTKLYSVEQLNDIIEEGVDITATNVYGRNILFYNQNSEILHDIYTHNVNLFIKDNFNANPLLFLNLPVLNEYINLIINEDKEKTISFINEPDKWGRLVIDHVWEIIKESNDAYQKQKKLPNENIYELITVLGKNELIQKNPENFIDYINIAVHWSESKIANKETLENMLKIAIGNNSQCISSVIESLKNNKSKNYENIIPFIETMKLEKVLQNNTTKSQGSFKI